MIEPNSIGIGVGATVVTLVTVKLIIKGLGLNNKPKNNPNNKFTKGIHDDLCTSRLEVVRTEIKGMETNIHTKLDFITDSIKEIKKHNENRRKEFRL